MTNILEQILETKKQELAQLRQQPEAYSPENYPVAFARPGISLAERLRQPGGSGIIAEFKRRSPSKGWFKPQNFPVDETITSYLQYGAAGCSVLTDQQYFGGELQDLVAARSISRLPLLRKDFIIDVLQLHQAKAAGADVVLLIAAILTPGETHQLAAEAKKLGLEVLLELHDAGELDHVNEHVDIVGVNNRNLRDFTVSLRTSLDLRQKLPSNKPAISESGITDAAAIQQLRYAGFDGFLVGEQFMKSPDPGQAFREFVSKLDT